MSLPLQLPLAVAHRPSKWSVKEVTCGQLEGNLHRSDAKVSAVTRRQFGSLLVFALLSSAAIAQVPDGDPFPIAQFTATTQLAPAAASQGDGNFIVVWSTPGVDGSGYGVQARRFNDRGVALTDEFSVNQSTAGTQHHPDVATDSEGNFVVVWRTYPPTTPAKVLARRFAADGSALGNEFQVNQSELVGFVGPSISATAEGDFVVAWGWNSDYELLASRFDPGGGIEVPEVAVNHGVSVEPWWSLSAALFSDNSFAVAWQGVEAGGGFPTPQIFQRRFSSSGQPLGPTFQVSSSGPYGTDNAWGPQAHANPADDFVVVWSRLIGLGYYTVALRVTTADGAVGPTRQILSFTERTFTSKVPSGEFVVADSSSYPYLEGDRGLVLDSNANTISQFPIPFFQATLRDVVATRDYPSTVVLLIRDGDGNLLGQTFRDRFFDDGFESGDTAAWPIVVP